MTEPAWPDALDRGLAEAALEPEAGSGDRAIFAPYDGGALVAVVDGLGHGEPAAEAAAVAAGVLVEHVREAPRPLLERCHAALRSGRGAVMTLAWFDLDGGRLTWTGVGNVEGRLVRREAGARAESPLMHPGVVGYNLPAVHPQTVALMAGDVLVLATDGIAPDFGGSVAVTLPAQTLAERILAAHRRSTDDALVATVRYRA